MDKNTLSNYGWIIVTTIIIALMIVLATPFGSYIGDAFTSVVDGFSEKVAEGTNGAITVSGMGDEAEAIPAGCTYIVSSSGTTLSGDNGDTFPTPAENDMYMDEEYCYTYNVSYDMRDYGSEYGTEWSVIVIDDSKTSYGPILSEIAGKPVTHMTYTFDGCGNMTTAPAIPDSVTCMQGTFNRCYNLSTAPVLPNNLTSMNNAFNGCISLNATPAIPNNVTDMHNAFWGCTSLVTVSTIPNSVTNMSYAFSGCVSLVSAPAIPSGVVNMDHAFEACALTSAPTIPSSVKSMNNTFAWCGDLVGSIEINANPTLYAECLRSTQITEVTGSTTLKDEILATK